MSSILTIGTSFKGLAPEKGATTDETPAIKRQIRNPFGHLPPGVSTQTTPGHIYFVQSVLGGPIKIGWATKPEVRLAALQANCPVTLELLHYEAGDGGGERALHKRFSDARSHGEWFQPVRELLDYIRERKAAALGQPTAPTR